MRAFTMALRRLLHERLFSILNIIGLGVGLACFLLIMLHVRDELGYERQFSKAARIYRVAVTVKPTDGAAVMELATNAAPVGPLLKQDFDEVEAFARLAPWKPAVKVDGGEAVYMSALLADASLFKLFDYQWLAGDPATALQQPASVVVTASTARRLFGQQQVLGRTLMLADQQLATVTGVIADPPHNSHLQFELLASMDMTAQAYNPRVLDSWYTQIFHVYVLLKPGARIEQLQPRFADMIARHLDQDAAGVFLQEATPLPALHLQSNRRGELGTPGSKAGVSAAAVIAVVVLLMACINFTNLATARAARRLREIGVRKAIGAARLQLAGQVLGETLLMVMLAMTVGVMLVELTLPAFNSLMQKQLGFDLAHSFTLLPLLALVIVVTLVAGFYPAFYLTSHQPSLVLRGLVAGGRRSAWLRDALVVVQFSAAIALLVCMATVHLQMQLLRKQDVGYQREQVVLLDNLGRDGVGRQWDAMKKELQAIDGVEYVTAAQQSPTQPVFRSYFISYEGGSERRTMTTMLVDAGFLETFGIRLVAGQGWTPGQSSYLLSAEAARQLGWTPQQAIGKWIEPTCCGLQRAPVSGVVQEVQYGALHAGTGPVLYTIPPQPGAVITPETRLGLGVIALKINGRNTGAVLTAIDQVWKRFHPDQPVTRSLLDDQFIALFQEEERQGLMLAAFAGLAIVIASLGLCGLASYSAERRTKEIGIRKVMGSSVWSIVLLLTNDFSKLVLIANVAAWPVAYYAMHQWLQNFAYRIDLTPLIFIGSGLIALCIAWVTVGGTAAKAASQKPVLALRYE